MWIFLEPSSRFVEKISSASKLHDKATWEVTSEEFNFDNLHFPYQNILLMAPLKNSLTFFGKFCQFFEISIILHLTKSLMIFAFSSVNVDLLTWCSCSKLSFISQRSNGKGLVTLDFLHNKFFFSLQLQRDTRNTRHKIFSKKILL